MRAIIVPEETDVSTLLKMPKDPADAEDIAEN
jgi:hypothetical protein